MFVLLLLFFFIIFVIFIKLIFIVEYSLMRTSTKFILMISTQNHRMKLKIMLYSNLKDAYF